MKRIVKAFFLILAIPTFSVFLLFAKIGSEDTVFQGFSQILSLLPGRLGIYYRAAFYRLACVNTSDDVSIGFLTLLSHRNTTIHRGVYIGPQCNIGMCTIGVNTLVGSGVHIISGTSQHYFDNPDQPIQNQGGKFVKISIGDDCWLGNLAVIGANVGHRSVIGTGSVVTKTIAPYSVVTGNPGKIVRVR